MRFGKVDLRYLGGVTLLAAILLITFSAATRRGTDWWAAWGQWVGGIGSIAAAVTAVGIAVEGWRRSDRQLKERETRELARQFAFWVHWTENEAPVVAYYNGAPVPAYDVHMLLLVDRRPVTPDIEIGNVGPTQKVEHHVAATAALRQALGHSLDSLFRTAQDPETGQRSMPVLEEMTERLRLRASAAIVVSFRDANGQRWHRDQDGRLVLR